MTQSITAPSAINTLKDAIAHRLKIALADYSTIATKLAAGEHVEADRIEHLLTAANKSVEDLEREVDRLKKRTAWRTLDAESSAVTAEDPTITTQIAAAGAALREAEQQHAAAIEPLLARRAKIREIQVAGAEARRQLAASYAGPLTTKLAEIAQQQRVNTQAQAALTADLHQMNEAATANETESRKGNGREFAATAEGIRGRMKIKAQALADLRQALEQILADDAAARAQMLEA